MNCQKVCKFLYNQYTVFGVSLCKYTTFRVLECVLYMPACDPG